MSSTDKRLDDLTDRQGRFEKNVERGFDRSERRVDLQFEKVDKRFEKVDEQFEKVGTDMKEGLNKLDSKVEATNRTLWVGIFVAVVVKFLFG